MLLNMRGMTDADPFAVRTMRSCGEEIAFSDPYVSDAQRAAAGRETVAERMRALLPDNRRRGLADRPARRHRRDRHALLGADSRR